MKVDVIMNDPLAEGQFADIKLSYQDKHGNDRIVDLNVDFESLNDFSNKTKSVAFDFFLVASIVYGVDNLLDRYEYSVDAWARDIEIKFPVNNIHIWNDVKDKLENIFSFLTGDYWTISFTSTTISEFFRERKSRRKSKIPSYNYGIYSFASLFSGGLDSLVGIIDQLKPLNQSNKGLLISHFDSTSPGPNADQHRILQYMQTQPGYKNKFSWLQTVVFLSTKDNNGDDLNRESSYRSRSLLFIAIGLFCIDTLPNCNTLIIPENGTISLNYPLTPSRSGTLSTRTTHPYYLEQLQILLTIIGLNIRLLNPYQYCTKGELVQSCLDQAVLNGIYTQSVSCGKRGRKQNWDTKEGTSHCGVCMPCIYRRAALHKIGADTQLYGIDIFSTTKTVLDLPDMPALFDFLKRTLDAEQIKRTLLANGSFEINQLDEYADLVVRVRAEIKKWIADKGNPNLKISAGII